MRSPTAARCLGLSECSLEDLAFVYARFRAAASLTKAMATATRITSASESMAILWVAELSVASLCASSTRLPCATLATSALHGHSAIIRKATARSQSTARRKLPAAMSVNYRTARLLRRSIKRPHSCGKGHEACVAPGHLIWKTRAENEADKLEHGTSNRGERHGRAKITEAEARTILSLKGEVHQGKLAARFGVSQPTIADIHAGRRWAWLSEEIKEIAS